MSGYRIQAVGLLLLLLGPVNNVNALPADDLHVPSPDWREQIIYFAMIDRFNDGNPSNNDQGSGEYDPGKGSHYSGGDLPGITDKIQYIKALGATAVWITPPVAHQWWSKPANYGGYHGYWAENLMQTDAHFGTLADMKALSRALHGQGMYLVQDVVVNHMGNYFAYDPKRWNPENPESGFRFETTNVQGHAPSQIPFRYNNAADPDQAARGIYHWTPDIVDYSNPVQEHNWQMAGLDDINTENAEVRKALRQSYGFWIKETGVDAFRVDTAFYVPPDYFRDFLYAEDAGNPGMFAVAKSTGRDDFHVFGEGFAIDKPFERRQSEKIEGYVRNRDGQALMPGMINFPLYGTGLDVFAKGQPTAQMRYRIETMMAVHENPHLMPSFVDNHDVDRFLAGGSEAALKQNLLLIMTLPGIPVIYYGTEQGFTVQRAAMFKAGYGSDGKDHFDTVSPMFKAIQAMTALRKSNRVFSHGKPTVLKDNPAGPGILAYRMQHGADQALIIFNTADSDALLDNLDTGLPAGSRLQVAYSQLPFKSEVAADAHGRLSLALPGRSALVLIPDGTQTAIRTHDGHLQISPPPAVVSADTLAVSGTGSPGQTLQLVLDGDLSHAQNVLVDGEGKWQAGIATEALMDPAIAHHLVLWDPVASTASEARTFRSDKPWREILRVDDPSGDDKGRTGLLRYPGDPGWGENRQGDIERITVHQAGSALKIAVTLHTISEQWNPPNGFDHVALTAFIELPGKTGGSRIMPLQNAELPDGMQWHYRLRANGWTNALFDTQGAGADNEGKAISPGAGLQVDKGERTISFILPAKALGNPESLSGMKLYVNTWDYDAGYRKLSPEGGNMTFGGGNPADAKVLDESVPLTIP
jgi:glycosidase